MKQKKIIIILVLVIILLISGGVTYFVMASNANKTPIFTYDPGEFFITNVSDSKCLVKADMLIEVSNKETNEYCRKLTLATSWSLTWQTARGGEDHLLLPYLMNYTAHCN